MKLRKNQIISPKNLPFPRKQIKNIHRAIWKFLGRIWNKLIFICVSPAGRLDALDPDVCALRGAYAGSGDRSP